MNAELKKQKEIKKNNERLKGLEIKRKKIQNELVRRNLPIYDTKEFENAHCRQVLKAKSQKKKYKKNKKIDNSDNELSIINMQICETEKTEEKKIINWYKKLKNFFNKFINLILQKNINQIEVTNE